MKNIFILTLAVALLSAGCMGRNLRTQGGTAFHKSADGTLVKLQQPQNPKDSSAQDLDIDDTFELPIPEGTKMTVDNVTKVDGHPVTNTFSFVAPLGTVMKKTHSEKSHSKVGAAQKDTLGETIAKLQSSKWITVLGIMILLGGVACAVYPPISTILGGFTPGAAIAASGLVIAILPYLIIGNEKFLSVGIAVSILGALAVWYIHHHGGLTKELTVLKSFMRPVLPTKATAPAPAPVPPAPFKPTVINNPLS